MALRAVSLIRDWAFPRENPRLGVECQQANHSNNLIAKGFQNSQSELFDNVPYLPPSGFHYAANRIHHDVRLILVDEMAGSIDDLPLAVVGQFRKLLLHCMPEFHSALPLRKDNKRLSAESRKIFGSLVQAFPQTFHLRRHGPNRSCRRQYFLLHRPH